MPEAGSNDYLKEIAEKLTINMAVNLLHGVDPAEDFPGRYFISTGRLHTGMGKWTTLAAIGIENGFKSRGLAENVVCERPSTFSGYGPITMLFLTPLGVEVGNYVKAHWDDLEFVHPERR